MIRRLSAITALITALSATGVVGAMAAEETVIIGDRLRPATIEIDSGTTVTWHNRDDERHRVRSKDGPVRFDSKNLDAGEAFSFTFIAPGEYPYYDHRDRDDADYFGTVIVGDAAGAGNDATAVEAAEVTIVDDAFTTSRVTIVPGGSVTWLNRGSDEHTVSANDLSFDSGSMASGATFSMAFQTPGEFPYFCQIHPEMRATVVVVGDPGIAVPVELDDGPAPDVRPEPETPTDDAPSADAPSIGSALDLLATPPPE